MKDTDIIIEVAKLDGWHITGESVDPEVPCHLIQGYRIDPNKLRSDQLCEKQLAIPDYLTSRDAIIPVIKNGMILHGDTALPFCEVLNELVFQLPYRSPMSVIDAGRLFLHATPRQLCIALLKATGKWRDE